MNSFFFSNLVLDNHTRAPVELNHQKSVCLRKGEQL